MMNNVIISGKIGKIDFNLVDKGKICAIAFSKLKTEKALASIVFENELADFAFTQLKENQNILIEGHLKKTINDLIVIVDYIENIDKESLEYGKMDKKCV